jgi:quinolinate synthase
MAPLVNRINQLKQEKNAVLLVHSYVSPEIIATVADFVGDSYGLSQDAMNTDAEIIIFCAVKFMAETAKILNPNKRVFVPTELNGCTLADAITAQDVQKLRKQFPDYTFVCYINTTAEVKAECDVCVTSGNVYRIIENLPNPNIYFLPDKLMGQNIAEELQKKGITKNLKYWHGTCYAHEAYEAEMIDFIRLQYPKVRICSHPECKPEVLHKSDFVGSTGQIINYVKTSPDEQFFLLTECGLTDRLKLDCPDKSFVGTCTLCKYMKANTLSGILQTLENLPKEAEIELNPTIQTRALACVQAMFSL